MLYESMLITGCGGDIAQALARVAREARMTGRLIGCDTHSDHPGSAFFDSCAVLPRADHPAYPAALSALAKEYGAEVIVPMSEAELSRLLKLDALYSFADVPVIAANSTAVMIGLDKYATYQRLREADVGVPWTRLVAENAPPEVPCIIKARRGQGSKGVRLVESFAEAELLSGSRQGDIWQEWLLPETEEYTCGLYRSLDGETRSLVLRRRLQGGLTGAAEVVLNAPIEHLLWTVADAIELRGSVNVQLRLTPLGPKVFEINPRFSSTVAFRHKLGFSDFVWSARERRGLEISDYASPAPGTRCYRIATELVLG